MTASAAMSSVSLPSPVPRMMPATGLPPHFERTAAAASWIWSKSDVVMATPGERRDVSPPCGTPMLYNHDRRLAASRFGAWGFSPPATPAERSYGCELTPAVPRRRGPVQEGPDARGQARVAQG